MNDGTRGAEMRRQDAAEIGSTIRVGSSIVQLPDEINELAFVTHPAPTPATRDISGCRIRFYHPFG
jgi:hypothetical protein